VLNDGVHTSVEFGYWRFALEVAGSVPSANSAPSAVDNPVWIAVYPSAELQSVAASIETMPNLASQPFQIKEVFGADHVPNRVKAGTQMLVMGVGLTMGGEGEKVEIARGASVTECTYVPRKGDLNTRIRATVPSTVPAGKGYSLLVTARGKHGEEPTTLSKGNIEIVAADLPPPTPIYTSTLGGTKVYTGVDDHEHDLPSGPVAVMATTDRLTLTGQLQATSETAPTTGITHVFIQDVTGDNIECPFAFGPTGTMKLNVGAALAEVPAGTYANAKFTFFCYTNGEQDGLTIPVVIEKS